MTKPVDHHEGIRIGQFTLRPFIDDKGCRTIWIQHSGGDYEGEGGAFDELALEIAIRAFYHEHF